ncbi:WG repeat-containing protein [Sporomusa sphaeroides]|uniref:WG repeat-containing protein n=1 Tax=Sporomusa sphaeroides TaxID=47679 RepID=UPI002BF0AF9C|nr:WG repeat-containing protein [Sporomusa sphaeroides]HML34907.1 WG repeat-containing protein [Sporomusa sphaeroides]
MTIIEMIMTIIPYARNMGRMCVVIFSELMGGSFGMLPVKKKTWGFMDTTGQKVIEPKYSEVGLFWNQEMLEREKSYYFN